MKKTTSLTNQPTFILGILGLFLLVVGIIASVLLSSRSQDVRQQAQTPPSPAQCGATCVTTAGCQSPFICADHNNDGTSTCVLSTCAGSDAICSPNGCIIGDPITNSVCTVIFNVASPTPTPSSTRTPTPSPTRTPSPTPSPTTSSTPTPTPGTGGSSPTPSPTRTPTPTPSPTRTPSPSPSPTRTPSPSPTGTPFCPPVAPVDPATPACVPDEVATTTITWRWQALAGANQYEIDILDQNNQVIIDNTWTDASAFNCASGTCQYVTQLPAGTYRSRISARSTINPNGVCFETSISPPVTVLECDATPTPTVKPTPTGLPEAGNSTPTLMILTAGAVVVIIGILGFMFVL